MFDMLYNVDFDLAAFVFTVLLFLETSVHYPKSSRKNRIFRAMALLVLLTESFDIITAFTNSYGASVSIPLNVFCNTCYFCFGLGLCFVLQYYIEQAVIPAGGKSVLLKTNKVILAVVEVAVLLNVFFGYFFYFTADGVYTHGVAYLLLHVVSLWFVLCASVALLVNRKLLKKAQAVSSFLFIGLYVSAVIVQTFFLPNVYLIMPAASAMLIVAIFSLESPDYLQLQKALQELTDTKQELEAANEKYFSLAYTDLMTGLANRSAYNQRLEQLEAAERPDIIFLMADINSLKHLNDNYGHLVGDEAIVKAAKLLSSCFTEGCVCYRIGGDEFAVIAENVPEAVFRAAYRRFLDIMAEEGRTSAFPFSLAVGCKAKGELSMQEVLKQTDIAMYRDKSARKTTLEAAAKSTVS